MSTEMFERKKMVYLCNAFSLQMLDTSILPRSIYIAKCQPEDVPTDAYSVIGHDDTAVVVGDLLGRNIEKNRESISLYPGDELYVAQVIGGRLPEGVITLPDGFAIEFLRVEVLA